MGRATGSHPRYLDAVPVILKIIGQGGEAEFIEAMAFRFRRDTGGLPVVDVDGVEHSIPVRAYVLDAAGNTVDSYPGRKEQKS